MAARSKYTQQTIDIILDGIKSNQGKCISAKNAGISYSTFCEWVNTKPEFSELIKKAEQEALENGHDTAVLCIFRAMENNIWQSAAWWLERNFPNRYSLKNQDEKFDELIDALKQYKNEVEK